MHVPPTQLGVPPLHAAPAPHLQTPAVQVSVVPEHAAAPPHLHTPPVQALALVPHAAQVGPQLAVSAHARHAPEPLQR